MDYEVFFGWQLNSGFHIYLQLIKLKRFKNKRSNSIVKIYNNKNEPFSETFRISIQFLIG